MGRTTRGHFDFAASETNWRHFLSLYATQSRQHRSNKLEESYREMLHEIFPPPDLFPGETETNSVMVKEREPRPTVPLYPGSGDELSLIARRPNFSSKWRRKARKPGRMKLIPRINLVCGSSLIFETHEKNSATSRTVVTAVSSAH
jgi:hypothetical protein